MPVNIVGNRWLFDPIDIIFFECPNRAQRLFDAPLHVHVNHQLFITAKKFSYGGDTFTFFRDRVSTNLNLYCT